MKTFKEYLNEVTTISTEKKLKDISNLKKLPDDVQKFLYREVEKFNSSGFQSMIGHVGRKAIIDMGGNWDDDKFTITSWGIDKKYKPKEITLQNYTGKI